MPDHDPERPAELTLTERELFEQLGWFTQVRWGAGACALGFLAIGWHLFRVRFAWEAATAVVGCLFVYNLVFALRVRSLHRRREISKRSITRLAHAQVWCDLVTVAALVHTIGGVENHFILLFIFPVIVASQFFATRAAYGYATLAAALINLIGWGDYAGYDTIHHRLEVSSAPGAVGADTLVAPGAAHHLIFVLQVCFVMSFAVYATVFIVSNIAGRLRSREEELGMAYRDLKSLEEVKSQFMRKASHELRAPVGAMQSLMNAALSQMSPGAAGRELIDRAVSRSESTLDMVDDLLRYSRLQGTVVPGRFEPVDLAEVLREAADLFRAQAEEKGIRLQVEAAPARVMGIRDSLADLVHNLLSNAIRYTPAGGRVSVEAGCGSGSSFLEVADTGIGIPADELPHIFEEFFRGEAARKTALHGTGLGMAIAKRVVDRHGGHIGVESKVGRGTTFRVALPPCLATS